MTKHFLSQIFWRPEIIAETRVVPDDFELDRERQLFMAMMSVHRSGGYIDEVSVSKVMDVPVHSLFEYKDPNIISGNWRYFENNILESSRQRRIKMVAEQILHSPLPSEELIVMFSKEAEASRDRAIFAPTSFQDCLLESVAELKKRMNGEGDNGITTGLMKLDKYIGGFQNRRLYYVGARPSGGKSALLLNFIMNGRTNCLVFSAESSKRELVSRAIIREGNLDSDCFMSRTMREVDIERVDDTASILFEKDLIIYDEPNISISKLISISYEMKRKHNIKAIYIDYIQILGHMPSKNDAYHLQVADTSKRLKQLARELDVPIICAAQLRRDAEGAKPKLSDFSDSTQIERDADVAIFIYNKGEEIGQETYLCIEKNRDGRTGDIPVLFEPSHFLFKDL